MITEFEKLREDERVILYDAPVLVAILIAGADGEIDTTEKKQAITIAQTKQTKAREQLIDYYQVVGAQFEKRFNDLIAELPAEAAKRNVVITSELRKLNFIFPKIDKAFSIALYASLKDIAKKIAESSGGLMGYLSVSYEESKLMELKMISNPQA